MQCKHPPTSLHLNLPSSTRYPNPGHLWLVSQPEKKSQGNLCLKHGIEEENSHLPMPNFLTGTDRCIEAYYLGPVASETVERTTPLPNGNWEGVHIWPNYDISPTWISLKYTILGEVV